MIRPAASMPTLSAGARLFPLAFVSLAVGISGCKSAPAPVSDQQLASTVQTTLGADSALAGQPIQASAVAGVVTLSGTVSNSAQRTLAARDVATIPGVTKVQDNLTLGPPPPAAAQVVAPGPLPPPPLVTARRSAELITPPNPRHPAPIERLAPPQNQSSYTTPPQPAYNPQPAAPPPPPTPAFRDVTVNSGETIPVRVTQTLDSASTQPDTSFSGVVASDIIIDGLVAIPAGSAVTGHVDAVQEAAHFKGASLLTVSLTSITRRGQHIAVTSEPYTVQGKGRGINTAEKTGGGAAVGAILGGIFGGGKGAAIGAAAGGGVGAGSQAITRGQQVQIASESVVRFHLASSLSVRVRTDASEAHPGDGNLQPR